jgi:hypothetical protein
VHAFKVPRLPRRRTLAAAIAAGVVGSFLVTAAPASAQVMQCNFPHTLSWAKDYPTFYDAFYGTNPTDCFGFVSDNQIDEPGQQVFCAGNNKGTVTYYDPRLNIYGTHTFWPGGVYEVVNGTYTQGLNNTTPDTIEILDVNITGYYGGGEC